MRRFSFLLVLTLTACGGPPPSVAPAPEAPPAGREAVAGAMERARPIPYPVQPPREYEEAVARGTRTEGGAPGPRYWQQRADYVLQARVDPEARILTGDAAITYHNAAPVPLPLLVLNLTQNFHAEGAVRLEQAEVTGGVTIDRVAVNGSELAPTPDARSPGWLVDGTLLLVVLPRPVRTGEAVDLEIGWSFRLPQAGASGRMGYSEDELLYLAYWFPQMAVYDDVIGWHAEPFRGGAEFYSGFGDYDLTVDAPAGWLVMATGALRNPEAVLAPDALARLRAAESSDDPVRVVEHGGAASATAGGSGGRLRWRFVAEGVRDVAFAVMRNHAWDAARAPIGDRDGDGEADHTRVDAFWRERAVHYDDAVRYAQHSLSYLSEFTGIPYPWPHMSVVEGGGIIGGGMEFPMMTLIGDYNERGDSALYSVTAHELAHMWVPMIVSTNERRYAWFDEGMTSFNENNARTDFFEGVEPHTEEQNTYLQVARARLEGPIMRWSDFHYPGPAYGVASYAKPASVLHALRGLLGEETFLAAYRAFLSRWAYRHPYPWDLFRTFEDVSGRDLGWFWRSWYYESAADGPWWLDQGVESVERLEDGRTRIVVRDHGWVPMPARLAVTREDGSVERVTIPVDRWLDGAERAEVTIPAGPPAARVEIDPEGHFPDMDRRNNVWMDR